MKKKTLGLLLAALMVFTSLWLPASLGGIREVKRMTIFRSAPSIKRI